jgi:MoaA/NifB/PqqE/SkfB family radical SAM enzyme
MKVMCLGDNSSHHAWGHRLTEKLALDNNATFRGMVPNNTTNLQDGYYHIGPLAMTPKDIIESTVNFDRVILLDQEQDKFSNHRIFLSMFKLVNDMKSLGINVEVMNQDNMRYLYYWEDLFTKNKSICVYPWLLLHDGYGDYTTLCGRSHTPVAKIDELKDWQSDQEYNKIREAMLRGERKNNCRSCHRYEDKGIRDQRWNYSFDWIARLKLKNIADLTSIKKPVYYEIRPTNKCNAMCRMCKPDLSHLIEKESKSINDKEFIELAPKKTFELGSSFDNVDVNTVKRLYVAGGEPTVMTSVYTFMEKCVTEKRTNFTFNINTNCVSIKPKFYNLCKQFPNLCISTSVDGVGKVNEYIRWNTVDEKQKQNIHLFHQQGNKVHITSVVSIYNVATLGDTMEMFDREFDYAPIQLQWAGFKGHILDPYNHPDRALVLKSLKKAKETKCYWHNESGTTNLVNNLYDFYRDEKNLKTFDRVKLRNFFVYNDTLDNSRGSRLVDYIPDLEKCRKYI